MADSLAQFDKIRPELEATSYFELSNTARSVLKSLSSSKGGLEIEAWSFVPHPDVFAYVWQVQRYIVTINTPSSDVYFAVHEFLKQQKSNIVSYYSGGWTDFVCDLRLEQNAFERWLGELRNVLESARAVRFVSSSHTVDALIAAFSVTKSYIINSGLFSEIGRPTKSILHEINARPAQFEVAFKNYRSPEALAAFGGDKRALHSYLRRLKAEGAILAFRAIANTPRYFTRDYVALSIQSRLVESFLQNISQTPELFKPVEELFQVIPVRVIDGFQQDVTHILINSYEFPGQRSDWKRAAYRWADSSTSGIGIRLYNYPLEGVVTETPIHLSDYPEFLSRIKGYANYDKGVFVGYGSYSKIETLGPPISLPLSGMRYHGLTVGAAGSGKTNTNLVLAEHALRFLRSVVILDGSKGVWNAALDSRTLRSRTRKIVLNERSTRRQFLEATQRRGLTIIEPPHGSTGATLEGIIEAINRIIEPPVAKPAHRIGHLLLIEEVQDAWSGSSTVAKARVWNLIRFLETCWLKGWCVWLCSQRILTLGPDEESSRYLLSQLRNRIIHRLDSSADQMALLDAFRMEQHSDTDLEYIEREFQKSEVGVALVRGVVQEMNDPIPLPPVLVKVPKLRRSRSDELRSMVRHSKRPVY